MPSEQPTKYGATYGPMPSSLSDNPTREEILDLYRRAAAIGPQKQPATLPRLKAILQQTLAEIEEFERGE